jgi:hypothetical protein
LALNTFERSAIETAGGILRWPAVEDAHRNPEAALVRANADQTNVSYLSHSELASRYEWSAELARGLTGIETVTDAVLNRT